MSNIPTKQLVDGGGGEFYPVTPLNITDANGGFNVNVRHKLIVRKNNKPIYDGQELTCTTFELIDLICNNYPIIFIIKLDNTNYGDAFFFDNYYLTSYYNQQGGQMIGITTLENNNNNINTPLRFYLLDNLVVFID